MLPDTDLRDQMKKKPPTEVVIQNNRDRQPRYGASISWGGKPKPDEAWGESYRS